MLSGRPTLNWPPATPTARTAGLSPAMSPDNSNIGRDRRQLSVPPSTSGSLDSRERESTPRRQTEHESECRPARRRCRTVGTWPSPLGVARTRPGAVGAFGDHRPQTTSLGDVGTRTETRCPRRPAAPVQRPSTWPRPQRLLAGPRALPPRGTTGGGRPCGRSTPILPDPKFSKNGMHHERLQYDHS